MKRLTLVLGLLGVLLSTAAARIDDSAQLGSAYPEIVQWPVTLIDDSAQLGSAYPEITQWPDSAILASASQRTKVKRVAMKQ